MAIVRLQTDRIDEAATTALVTRDDRGAICTFSGTVRNHSRGKRVLALEYTAHEPLALREMQRIADEAEAKWSAVCAVVHRLGVVPIGESTIYIAVATAHRPAAFEACRWIIDTVKETVPIWKRETTENAEVWIEGDAEIPTVSWVPEGHSVQL